MRAAIENTAFLYEWGSRGRWFESSHSDQLKLGKALELLDSKAFLVFQSEQKKFQIELKEILLLLAYCLHILSIISWPAPVF